LIDEKRSSFTISSIAIVSYQHNIMSILILSVISASHQCQLPASVISASYASVSASVSYQRQLPVYASETRR
jgi:hypothetical protein